MSQEELDKNVQFFMSLSEDDLKEIFAKMSLTEVNDFVSKIENLERKGENNG
ncbi:MAG TPA: hypothetical protein PLX66_00480 [Bacilli bacterium]|nr:hypothetical protein [Bacilli bacterium]